MRRDIRAIGWSRVGNPPVAAKSRLRSARPHAIVSAMVFRRELLPFLLAAAFLLVGPGQALAAPTWLDAEPQDDDGLQRRARRRRHRRGRQLRRRLARRAARSGRLPAARRRLGRRRGPRPGASSSRRPARHRPPNGEFVAAWVAGTGGTDVLRSATRSPGGEWTRRDVRRQLLRGASWRSRAPRTAASRSWCERTACRARTPRRRAATPWGAGSRCPPCIRATTASPFAPDGSALGIGAGGCGDTFDCLEASYRSPGAEGAWGD